jgi:hypothetical protein
MRTNLEFYNLASLGPANFEAKYCAQPKTATISVWLNMSTPESRSATNAPCTETNPRGCHYAGLRLLGELRKKGKGPSAPCGCAGGSGCICRPEVSQHILLFPRHSLSALLRLGKIAMSNIPRRSCWLQYSGDGLQQRGWAFHSGALGVGWSFWACTLACSITFYTSFCIVPDPVHGSFCQALSFWCAGGGDRRSEHIFSLLLSGLLALLVGRYPCPLQALI